MIITIVIIIIKLMSTNMLQYTLHKNRASGRVWEKMENSAENFAK